MTALHEAAQQALLTLEWHLAHEAYGADIEGVTGALRAALADQPQTTHSEECWRWHHACAVAKIERLRAEVGDAR